MTRDLKPRAEPIVGQGAGPEGHTPGLPGPAPKHAALEDFLWGNDPFGFLGTERVWIRILHLPG